MRFPFFTKTRRYEIWSERWIRRINVFRTELPHVFASTTRLCIGIMSLMQWLSKTKTRSHTEADIVIKESSTSTTKVADENGGRDQDQPCHSTEENSENLDKTSSSNSTKRPKPKPKQKKAMSSSSSTPIKRKKKESHRWKNYMWTSEEEETILWKVAWGFFWLERKGKLMFCTVCIQAAKSNKKSTDQQITSTWNIPI